MNKHHWVVLPSICIAASVMLGGCITPEPGDGAESMTEAEPGDGAESMTEAEPTGEAAAALLTTYVMAVSDGGLFNGGRASFEPYGDKVVVCDTWADGRGVSLKYNGKELRVSGKGSCVTRSASNGGSYNLEEGKSFRFTICLIGTNFCNTKIWPNVN